MFDKIKSIFKNKKFITFLLCLPFVSLVIFITWPLPAIIIGDPIIHLYVFVKLYWKMLVSILLIITATILFAFCIWPIVKYLLHKIYIYVSLYRICSKNKYKFETVRSPLASFKGLRSDEDIKITTPEDTYRIHFVDVIRTSKTVIDVSAAQYSITYKESKKTAKKVKDPKPFDIPEFPSYTASCHIFLVSSPRTEVRILRGNNRELMANESKFNSMIFSMPMLLSEC